MLEWSRGRNLVKYGAVSYAYNASGIRQEKTANGVVHKYYLEGTRIHKETYGNNTLWYYYDQTGITGLEYNGTKYYFQKNIQNDVVRIFDEYGILVATYEYDAWGNHKVLNANGFETTETTFIGNINPFRYRGYYYDVETGLYYLNSRYYDPRICRFINADSLAYISPEAINGVNLYAYCSNDPVNRFDPSGHFWDYILDAVFIALGIQDFINDPSWSKGLWLALDIGLAILPFIPAISSARHLGKIDDVVDLTKIYGHIDNFADSGGLIRRANKMDFIDNGWDLVQGLNRTEDGFTISNSILGTNIHTKFLNGGRSLNKLNRVDGIDDTLKIIYELKPYNKRNIRKGIKQLYRYQKVALQEYGSIYKMILVLY